MATTPITGLPYPTGGDVPNVPVDIAALAAAADALMPVGFRRTRTTAVANALTGSAVPIVSWPTLSYSQGNFGSYSGGIFTFSKAGLYTWEMPVQWPNDVAYKVSARLLINGALSPDDDNIADGYVFALGAAPTLLHRGTYPADVGDTWQMSIAANINRDASTITPQSWAVMKAA